VILFLSLLFLLQSSYLIVNECDDWLALDSNTPDSPNAPGLDLIIETHLQRPMIELDNRVAWSTKVSSACWVTRYGFYFLPEKSDARVKSASYFRCMSIVMHTSSICPTSCFPNSTIFGGITCASQSFPTVQTAQSHSRSIWIWLVRICSNRWTIAESRDLTNSDWHVAWLRGYSQPHSVVQATKQNLFSTSSNRTNIESYSSTRSWNIVEIFVGDVYVVLSSRYPLDVLFEC
jgi:hypothetical protein